MVSSTEEEAIYNILYAGEIAKNENLISGKQYRELRNFYGGYTFAGDFSSAEITADEAYIVAKRTKEEVFGIIDQSNPKEAKRMISNMAESFRKTYEEAVREGIVQGKMEGKIEGKIETAQNMLAKNMPEELIAEVTGLPIEQIKSLKNEDMH